VSNRCATREPSAALHASSLRCGHAIRR
jgi:hypothetical protein